MKRALIFLNCGYYDTRHLDFYRQEIQTAVENGFPLICADGGIRIFDELNRDTDMSLIPDVLIGDMDSVPHRGYKPLPQEEQTLPQAKQIVPHQGYKPLPQGRTDPSTSKADRSGVGRKNGQRLHGWTTRRRLRPGTVELPTYHHLRRLTASRRI